MKDHQAALVRAIKRARNDGLGYTRIANMLSIGRLTVRRVLNGDPKACERVAYRPDVIDAVKKSEIRTRKRRLLPPQLRALDPAVWLKVKQKCRAWGYEICARWWNTTPDELEAHVMSRSKVDAADVLKKILLAGIPDIDIEDMFSSLRLPTDHKEIP